METPNEFGPDAAKPEQPVTPANPENKKRRRRRRHVAAPIAEVVAPDLEKKADKPAAEKPESKDAVDTLRESLFGPQEGVLFDRRREETTDTDQPKAEADATDTAEPETELPDAVEREIADEIAADRQDVVESELTASEPDSEASKEAEADSAFLTNLRERIAATQADVNREGEPIEDIIDDAARETMQHVQAQPEEQQQAQEAAPESAERPDGWIDDLADEVAAERAAEKTPVEDDPTELARRATEAAYAESEPAPSQPLFEAPKSAEPAIAVNAAPHAPETETPQISPNQVAAAGFLSFLFGRHSGRKRAEKKATSTAERAKKQFEKTVTTLNATITDREARIRDLQRSKQAAEAPVAAEKPPMKTGRPEFMTMQIPAEPAKVESAKPEAVQPKPASQAERPVAYKSPEAPAPQARAERLSTPELVATAAAISVDGVSVRSMFEVGRFDEQSLRLIVSEYLRGGDVTKVVAQEVTHHDRERFRRFETLNQASIEGAAPAQSTSRAVQAAQAIQHSQQPMQPVTPGSLPKPVPLPPADQTSNKKQDISTGERVVLWASLTAITVALVLIIAAIASRA